MSLEELRKRIDAIDDEIVGLIAQRARAATEIGNEKRKQNKKIEDPGREEAILERVRQLARREGINEQDVESLYRQIVNTARSLQGVEVAFQGEIGAYSEEAAFRFFGRDIQVKPFESLEEVFRAVEQDKARFGIVPIENSLEGSIAKVYDLLLDSSLKVAGEIGLRVSHALIANPGATLDSIKRIYSHPQALGQCQAFLKHLNSELIPTYDTAGGVKLIKEKGITDGAAIASTRAAEIYGMKIISSQIEDSPNNYTRFFILAKHDSPPTGRDKTSIVFSVKHKPGALIAFLEDLARRKINLTKIESRPTRQKPWEYNFYLDFEGHREDKAAREALEGLGDLAIYIKVLGSYPRARKQEGT
jgi:chorismate mutase/prephenate dehydratase